MKTFKSSLPELKLKYTTGKQKKVKIGSSKDAFSVLKNLYDSDTIEYRETAIVLYLNRANNTIGWMKVSDGGMYSIL